LRRLRRGRLAWRRRIAGFDGGAIEQRVDRERTGRFESSACE
jgi:hypothetical protein